jgi:hypothetical protein
MHIAAANAARAHAYEDFIRLHRRLGKIFAGETVIIFEDQRFHVEKITDCADSHQRCR